jgi:cell division septation protein DedD
MNEHSLDDLIIGEPSPTTKKSKSLLAIIALIVIILLVGILLSKMIMDTSGEGIDLSEENQTTFVSPDLIPMNPAKIEKHTNDLAPITKEKLPQKQPPKVIKKPVESKKPIITKPAKPKVKSKPKISEKPKIIKNQKPKITPKPKALFAKGKPTYFIQIGAFNRDPNPKFLKKVENAGLTYVIHKNEKTRRVRVGPYGSYAEAKAALSDVNSSIGIAGFVVKQK